MHLEKRKILITFRNPSSRKILDAMQCAPDITIKDLVRKAGGSVSAANKRLRLMAAKGCIQRRMGDGNA